MTTEVDSALWIATSSPAACAKRACARGTSREFVREPLPDDLRFRVHLNSSYDGHPRVGDEVVYPEHSAFGKAMTLHEVTEEQVLTTLWRGGRVPEWINPSVAGETGTATLIDVVCCGRFTADERLLYHAREGRPPFHVLGPTLPVGYQEGERFSIYHWAACWTPADIERVVLHADDVWSLDLIGPAFTDRPLAAIHEFRGLEILEMKQVPITGPGLRGLARLPRLRVLRVDFAPLLRIDLSSMPSLPTLTVLDLTRLPAEVTGVAGLGGAAELEWLTLQAAHRFELDAPLPELPRLKRFSLTAPAPPRSPWPCAPGLHDLALHIESLSDAEVVRAASPYPHLRALSLRATSVTDAFLDELHRWPALEFLNVVDGRVTAGALRGLAVRRPTPAPPLADSSGALASLGIGAARPARGPWPWRRRPWHNAAHGTLCQA
ncbi:hypothetical protein BE20_13765 [Sorangium cellulosum]|uniref:Leucine-rich repeat domain-containing protein n=1 Tax=Sorangium cellulosum TaxID=56 RepID=A0A150SZL7_SORCE|nr:hypothetical protein BE20_13765 [Sorangium cellulosum]KYF97863.1 hypothetical protein BE18_41925 [Sorangium cellulosum]